MKKISFILILLMVVFSLSSCGGDSTTDSNDSTQGDVLLIDVADNGYIMDTSNPDIDSGKECLFPCNADEVCIDGECVLIGDDTTVKPDASTDILDISYDV
ncbi:MAG: lipoprotein, partial [Myxococcota bacterium]